MDKNANKQIKMADLQLVDFALMPGPVRKEKQFGLPDDFSRIDVAIFSDRRAIRRRVFLRSYFKFSRQHGRTPVRRYANFFTRRARSKKFPLSERSQRSKSSLTILNNVNKRSMAELKAFLAQAKKA